MVQIGGFIRRVFKSTPIGSSEMVEDQIVSRGITDPNVIRAMEKVPRHCFVDEKFCTIAYSDQPLPIGYEQTISQPYVVAFMTQALKLDGKSRVLEVGTGSGYQAAVLAEIAKEVYSIEIIEELVDHAKSVLERLRYRSIKIKVGNGREGWAKYAPYSHIIVTAASENIPSALIKQLNIAGRMIIPVGSSEWAQNLVLVTKTRRGITQESILPVRFVPLVMGERYFKRRTSKKGGAKKG